jgi:uncharacterized protein GlcG (DUF336 family)
VAQANKRFKYCIRSMFTALHFRETLMRIIFPALLLVTLTVSQPTIASDGVFAANFLLPETAVKAATAALAVCRKNGYQVAVAVVDRSGIAQVLLRDRFAGAHTPDMAINKAWTSASFKVSTEALARETTDAKSMSGIRGLPRVIAAGGGLPIVGAGSTLGGIGVSGAPSGEADTLCAQAGIDAIKDLIEF